MLGTNHRNSVKASFVICIALLLGCGGGGGSSPAPPAEVSISISPASITLDTGDAQSFTATVTGSTNRQVTWQVNGVAGGNPDVGTVSTSGLYTAPTIPPSPNVVTVRATSVGDPTRSASASVTVVNPRPAIQTLAPSSLFAGSSDTPLTLTGAGFAQQSSVLLGTTALETTFVSPSQLTALIPAPQLTMAGTFQVAVVNPSPGGGTSTPGNFTVVVVVAVTPAGPTVLVSQTQQFTATVRGSTDQSVSWLVNCVAGGVACGSIDRASGLYLASALPPSPNTVTITAIPTTDPSQSGMTTASIVNPAPSIGAISPTSVNAGSVDTALTVDGAGFAQQSAVWLAGTALTTTFLSSGQLRAMIPATQLVNGGALPTTVVTPAPGGGTSNPATLTITQPPAITSGNNATFTVGEAGLFTVTATAFPTPTLSQSGTLPGGVTFNAGAGVLSGTPAAGTGGTYGITFKASNGMDADVTQNFTLTVNQLPAITSTNTAAFTVGTAGSFTVTATGFPTPSFSQGGTLPSGVTFNSITRVLSGRPAAGTGGTYNLTFTASNGVTPDFIQNLTLTVQEPPTITSPSSMTLTVGTLGSFAAVAIGFPKPTLSQGGTLPSGVTFNASTGMLSGTPAAGTGGTYNITFTASNGISPNATQTFTLTVNKAGTTTSVSPSANPSVFGQTVTFTAAVTPASGASTPGGTVQFKVDGAILGSPVPLIACNPTPSACAAAATSSLAVTSGTPHTVEAAYSGDASFDLSTGTLSSGLAVNRANTSTGATSSLNPSTYGQAITLTATVVPLPANAATAITGSVTFTDGVTTLATVAITDQVYGGNHTGVSAFTTADTALVAGSHSIVASYSGDGNFNVSTSAALAQTVNKASTTTTITTDLSAATVVGQAYTVKWSVSPTPSGGGTPTGIVTVTGDGTCSAAVPAGQCGMNSTTAGAKTLTASYAGDANFNASTSACTSHPVNKADTTSTVTTELSTATVVGESYIVAFAVMANAPGGGTPTGIVTVGDGLADCSASIATGQCLLASTSAGAKTITATYTGDANFNASISAGVSHPVSPASTTTTITSHSPNPSIVNQPVTVGFVVGVSAPGSGTATGNVTVSDGTGASCVATVAAGSCPLTPTTTGDKTLTASYASDANFAASTSAPVSHTSGQPPAITSVNSTIFSVYTVGSFTVTTTGFPAPNLSVSGTLPTGVTFDAGSGVLSGTPAAGSGGTYPIAFTASNGLGSDPIQSFTLTVNNPTPTATSISPDVVNFGSSYTTLTVTGTGFIPQSTVTVGTSSLTPTVSNPTEMSVIVPPSELTSPGQVPVTVTNPGPGGGTSTPVIYLEISYVKVSPSAPTLVVNQTQQFTADVFSAPSQPMSWWVNDVEGGDSTAGTISAAGLYIAPGTVPTPATVLVKAVNAGDPSQFGSAVTTVTLPASDNYPRPDAGSVLRPSGTLIQVPQTGWKVAVLDWTTREDAYGTQEDLLAVCHVLSPLGIPHDHVTSVPTNPSVYPFLAVAGVLDQDYVFDPTALTNTERDALANYVRNGGTLFLWLTSDTGVLSRLNLSVTHTYTVPANTFRRPLTFDLTTLDRALDYINYDVTGTAFEEAEVQWNMLYPGGGIPTFAYSSPGVGDVLATWDAGGAAVVRSDLSGATTAGRAYVFGWRLRHDLTDAENGIAPDDDLGPPWTNTPRLGADICRLLVRGAYEGWAGANAQVRQFAPNGKKAALILTHDIDDPTSYELTPTIAALEAGLGVKATYNFTTNPYESGWKEPFYDSYGMQQIQQALDLGMDVQSHGIGHFPDFNLAPLTLESKTESAANYFPQFSTDFGQTIAMSVLGELGVSRWLLEYDFGITVDGFRSGFLLDPPDLFEGLKETGYMRDSTRAAGVTRGSFPFVAFTVYDLTGDVTTYPIVEYPVAVSDDHLDMPFDSDHYNQYIAQWKSVITANYYNNAPTVLLIHPVAEDWDEEGALRRQAEQEIIEWVRDYYPEMWIGDWKTFAEFWEAQGVACSRWP